MKTILFYGDSNTYGFDPSTCGRYPYEARWTTICARELGEDYCCIPAGMNGRATIFDDPLKGCRNGLTGLDYELQSHKPLDLVVVMLGTNDLKYTDAEGSAAGLRKLLEDLLSANERYHLSSPVFPDGAKVLLISPVLVKGTEWFGASVDAAAESQKFASFYQSVAEQLNQEACRRLIYFFDAKTVAEPSDLDGVHLGMEGHRALGEAVAQEIRRIPFVIHFPLK